MTLNLKSDEKLLKSALKRFSQRLTAWEVGTKCLKAIQLNYLLSFFFTQSFRNQAQNANARLKYRKAIMDDNGQMNNQPTDNGGGGRYQPTLEIPLGHMAKVCTITLYSQWTKQFWASEMVIKAGHAW